MRAVEAECGSKALGAVGLRSTAASRALLALFEPEGCAMLTRVEIDDLLRARQVEINRVTLYRLLDRFVAAGLIRRFVDPHRVARYGAQAAPCADTFVRPRFECRQCQRLYQLA